MYDMDIEEYMNNDWLVARVGVGTVTVTSQGARWRLKSPAPRLLTQPFIQAQIKENIKAPRNWHLCGEFTSNAEYVFTWWRHHGRTEIDWVKIVQLNIEGTNIESLTIIFT